MSVFGTSSLMEPGSDRSPELSEREGYLAGSALGLCIGDDDVTAIGKAVNSIAQWNRGSPPIPTGLSRPGTLFDAEACHP